jgi:hypothetical protein
VTNRRTANAVATVKSEVVLSQERRKLESKFRRRFISFQVVEFKELSGDAMHRTNELEKAMAAMKPQVLMLSKYTDITARVTMLLYFYKCYSSTIRRPVYIENICTSGFSVATAIITQFVAQHRNCAHWTGDLENFRFHVSHCYFRLDGSSHGFTTVANKPADPENITCKRGSAKYCVKDDFAFPWKHVNFG